MRTIRNYAYAWTEDFREWLAWKIFPEFGFYMEAMKRMAEIDENERCKKALEDADSACSGWAVDVIGIKYTSVFLQDMYKEFKEQGLEEPPF